MKPETAATTPKYLNVKAVDPVKDITNPPMRLPLPETLNYISLNLRFINFTILIVKRVKRDTKRKSYLFPAHNVHTRQGRSKLPEVLEALFLLHTEYRLF